jgi:phenylacetate-CoA ligase
MSQTPYSATIWDERETWSRDRMQRYQADALRRQLSYVAERSDYYRKRFADVGFEPGPDLDPEDLRQLPVTRKSDYLGSLEAAPPWGSALACEPADVRRVHFSSGTTSRPTPMVWTSGDLARWADLYARAAYSQGVRRDDVYQCFFSFSWFVGGLGGVAGYERVGATCIPGGSVDSHRQIDTLFEHGTTCIGGTPSFILHLAEVAADMGRDLRDSSVERIMVGGEPGAGIPATRARIEEAWGASCRDGYGSLEFQPIAWECHAGAGGHLADDFALAELLDPDTLEPVPNGQPGVLVLTHLDKVAAPLVRWWTGDVVVRDVEPCECGRTLPRLPGGVRGRADDMLVIRGVNVFPSAVEDVVRATPGTTGEFQIVIDGDVQDPETTFMTGLKLRVEAGSDSPADLSQRLAERIRSELRVRAEVLVVEAGTLPRATHKATRIIKETDA